MCVTAVCGGGRDQMDRALQSLREEVSALQEEEKGKLEEQKRKALERLHSQVHTGPCCVIIVQRP